MPNTFLRRKKKKIRGDLVILLQPKNKWKGLLPASGSAYGFLADIRFSELNVTVTENSLKK